MKEAEQKKVDAELARRCGALAGRVARGDARALRLACLALGRSMPEVAAAIGCPTHRFVECVNGKAELPGGCRDSFVRLMRDADSSCTHCGAAWWPPQLELCKWCGEPANEEGGATVNNRRQPFRARGTFAMR